MARNHKKIQKKLKNENKKLDSGSKLTHKIQTQNSDAELSGHHAGPLKINITRS